MFKPSIMFFLAICLPSLLEAQVFDERMSDWPVDFTLRGTVIVCPQPNPTEQVTRDFLRAGGKQPRVVGIFFDEPMNEPDTNTLREDAESLYLYQRKSRAGELRLMEIGSSDTESQTVKKTLQNATAIFLCATNPLDAEARQWLQMQAPEFHDCVRRGGVILGCGDVGRLFGSRELVLPLPNSADSQATTRPGLNLLPDVILQTDFKGSGASVSLLNVLSRFPKAIGIGMEPQTCLILRGRKVAAKGGGQLHFFTAANSRVPVRKKAIGESKNSRFDPYQSLVDLTAWRRDAIDRTREIFPPANPAIPCVPKGTLMIIGGGGMPAGLMEQFIERAGGENAKLIYIPCTERETLSSRESRLVQSWRQKGVASADVFHTKDRLKADRDELFLKPLAEATGIFFGGGRQWNFSDSYYGTKAHRLMKAVLERGGVIAGSSAGASIQARYLARANPLGNRDIMATGYERGGLGFISGVAIDQHFTQRGRQADMSALVNRYPQLLGIGIDERTAILVEKSRAEVIGEGDVYFYDRHQRSTKDRLDYLKLGAGKEYDLAKREVVLLD